MSYERTEEVRSKQSAKMKAVTAAKTEEEWDAREEKTRASFAASGKHRGRPPKDRPTKICPQCKEEYRTVRLYCSGKCYHDSKKGKRFLSTEFLKSVDRSYPRPGAMKLDRKTYKGYRASVSKLTEQVYAEYIDEINPNRYPRTINGVEGGYQLDHVESVRNCFDAGHPPEYAARKENLQMLPWKDNLMKGKK